MLSHRLEFALRPSVVGIAKFDSSRICEGI